MRRPAPLSSRSVQRTNRNYRFMFSPLYQFLMNRMGFVAALYAAYTATVNMLTDTIRRRSSHCHFSLVPFTRSRYKAVLNHYLGGFSKPMTDIASAQQSCKYLLTDNDSLTYTGKPLAFTYITCIINDFDGYRQFIEARLGYTYATDYCR